MAEVGAVSRNRAKVYQLNAMGQWDDRGTGFAACQYLQAYGFACIILVNEDDQTPILETRVSPDEIYQRQGDTIISWTEPANGCDVALSFADAAGCTDLWDQICTLQRAGLEHGGGLILGDGAGGAGSAGHGTLGGLVTLPTDRGGTLGESGQGSELVGHEATVELPTPELPNIKALADALREITIYQRPVVVQLILKQDYVAQLAKLFQTVEDLESLPDLHAMCHIFRTLVMLNDTAVFEQLLREDVIMSMIGALEYDPELMTHNTRHREFLQRTVEFKEVIPIREPAILAKIHQNFRVQYIKDVVLPRALDDNTFATLNSITFMNNVAILGHIQGDTEYLRVLFTQLHDAQQPVERRRELSRLLLELCLLARNLQVFNRASFYRRLMDFGLFTPIASLLMSEDPTMQLNAAEVLGATCQHDPSMLRQFVLLERPDQHTMGAVMHVLTIGSEAGVKAQLVEVLRALLDTESMEGLEQEDFLTYFYEHFISSALAPLESAGKDTDEAEAEAEAGEPDGKGEEQAGDGAEDGPSPRPRTDATQDGDDGARSAAPAPVASASALASEGETAAAAATAVTRESAADATGATVASERAPSGDVGTLSVPADPTGAGDGTAADPRGACTAGGRSTALSSPHASSAPDDEALHASRSLVVELLRFCVQHHGYRIKYFVLKNHVIAKVLRLCRVRDKPLILAAVRFLRSCIGLKDEFYNRYIAKNNCLEPLIEQLVSNAWLDNLLASAVIELLDFIKRENIRSLLAHLHESHRLKLDLVRPREVVEGLWLRHEQNEHGAATGAMGDGHAYGAPEADVRGVGDKARLSLGRGLMFDNDVDGRGDEGATLHARPPRRAPPPGVGLRAFPDEEEDAAYFEGSDGEDEAVEDGTYCKGRGLHTSAGSVRSRGNLNDSAFSSGADLDDSAGAAAAAAVAAVAAVTGDVLAYGAQEPQCPISFQPVSCGMSLHGVGAQGQLGASAALSTAELVHEHFAHTHGLHPQQVLPHSPGQTALRPEAVDGVPNAGTGPVTIAPWALDAEAQLVDHPTEPLHLPHSSPQHRALGEVSPRGPQPHGAAAKDVPEQPLLPPASKTGDARSGNEAAATDVQSKGDGPVGAKRPRAHDDRGSPIAVGTLLGKDDPHRAET